MLVQHLQQFLWHRCFQFQRLCVIFLCYVVAMLLFCWLSDVMSHTT